MLRGLVVLGPMKGTFFKSFSSMSLSQPYVSLMSRDH